MESDVAQRDADPQRHTEGLDRAIEVLIVDGVFIMPNAGGLVRHLVNNKRAAIDPRLGLDRAAGRAGPGTGGWRHSHRGSYGRKVKLVVPVTL